MDTQIHRKLVTDSLERLYRAHEHLVERNLDLDTENTRLKRCIAVCGVLIVLLVVF